MFTVVRLKWVLESKLLVLGTPMSASSSFEKEVKELCKQIVACGTEQEAIELARNLRVLLHERVEHLRGNVLPIDADGSVNALRKAS